MDTLTEVLKEFNPTIRTISDGSFYVRMKRKKSGKQIDFQTWLASLISDFKLSTYWTDGVNVIFIITFV
jgi:hypothetical protein